VSVLSSSFVCVRSCGVTQACGVFLWFHAGAVSTADGSALVKIGNTTMLAGVKLEVMVPSQETPDQGSITVDFQMPPICSPLVRPGRPVEAASVISEQLSNVLTRVGQFE
jgi:exosome complex component RRP43